MNTRLIDLLPEERKRAFRMNYFLRLATTGTMVVVALVILHGVLLLPTYFTLAQATENARSRLQSVNERLAASGDHAILSRLAVLEQEARHLSESRPPTASASVRHVLALPRPGISVTGLAFNPPQGNEAGVMRVTGVAASREALRSYQGVLASVPGVSGVDLPISSYAKESDIPFTLTISGSFISHTP